MKDQVDWVPDERLIAEIAAVPEMVRLLKSACRAAEIAGHRDLEEKIWNLLIAVGAISVITNQEVQPPFGDVVRVNVDNESK